MKTLLDFMTSLNMSYVCTLYIFTWQQIKLSENWKPRSIPLLKQISIENLCTIYTYKDLDDQSLLLSCCPYEHVQGQGGDRKGGW